MAGRTGLNAGSGGMVLWWGARAVDGRESGGGTTVGALGVLQPATGSADGGWRGKMVAVKERLFFRASDMAVTSSQRC